LLATAAVTTALPTTERPGAPVSSSRRSNQRSTSLPQPAIHSTVRARCHRQIGDRLAVRPGLRRTRGPRVANVSRIHSTCTEIGSQPIRTLVGPSALLTTRGIGGRMWFGRARGPPYCGHAVGTRSRIEPPLDGGRGASFTARSVWERSVSRNRQDVPTVWIDFRRTAAPPGRSPAPEPDRGHEPKAGACSGAPTLTICPEAKVRSSATELSPSAVVR
jgi:hypothetical protein